MDLSLFELYLFKILWQWCILFYFI